MSVEISGSTEKLAVHRMDYLRLLRDSHAAFACGYLRDGQKLLDMAAEREKSLAGDVDEPAGGPRRRLRHVFARRNRRSP